MSYAIETNGLTKDFGRVRAVDAVDLRVSRGEIYGFLGLNGAGKSTTIRLLLGMIRPDAGSIQVLGRRIRLNAGGPWRQVGHLVEEAAAYPELSVRENLEIARRLQEVPNREATAQVIERLGLIPYADRRAGTLSTGNLQRLGIARALLHEPELLILDEPAKGLDPAGVVEMRELLASLAHEQGVTVFMSSHILTEVDRLATRIGIIHEGKLLEELDAHQLEAMRAQRLEIQVHDPETAREVLKGAGFAVNTSDGILILNEARAIDAPEKIAVLLVSAGIPPSRLAVEQEDLEDHFLHLVGVKA